jgi:GH24 family phage-related lysozyme (muramidase)
MRLRACVTVALLLLLTITIMSSIWSKDVMADKLPEDSFRHIINEVFLMSNKMDMDKLRAELIADEADRNTAYHCPSGFPTVGIGHKITSKDIIEVGDTISPAHKARLFEQDVAAKLADCKRIYPAFETYPVSVQEALFHMVYNIGPGAMAGYKGFNAVIETQNWGMVADYLRKNFKLWYSQIGARAKRIEDKFTQAARGI